jgi:hypothetical protein
MRPIGERPVSDRGVPLAKGEAAAGARPTDSAGSDEHLQNLVACMQAHHARSHFLHDAGALVPEDDG